MLGVLKISLLSLLFAHSLSAFAAPQKIDGMYVNTFGVAQNQPLIFIHGGPGYDSQNFESTTAQKLAESGFFVIVYDQRGQGRSEIATHPEVYQYKPYADDLKSIIDNLKLKNPILMGHSHGGAIALKFEEYYPKIAKRIILVSAPVLFWDSIQNIQSNCSKKYISKNDKQSLISLKNIFQKLDSKKLSLQDQVQYTSLAFQQALQCGLYQTNKPTKLSLELNRIGVKNYVQPVEANLIYPMGNFIIYENYTHADYSNFVTKNASKIFGIYGNEDGLFSDKTLNKIKSTMLAHENSNNFTLIKSSSHNVFIDQQDEFIKSVDRISKR